MPQTKSKSKKIKHGTKRDWAVDFFDGLYADIFLDWTDEKKMQTAQLVARLLDLDRGKIFDQCCGVGALAQGLTGLGFEVTGMDINPQYISRARNNVPKGQFEVGDARFFVAPQNDGACCWHSSIGYGKRSDIDRQINCINQSVKKNKLWLLEVANPRWVRAHLQPIWKQDYSGPTGLVTITRHSHFESGVMRQIWERSEQATGVVTSSEPSRMHILGKSEWKGVIERSEKAKVIGFFDDQGRNLTPASPRMVVLCQRI